MHLLGYFIFNYFHAIIFSMAVTYNYSWEQGSDLVIALVYKAGPEGSAVPVNLTNYSFRMDIVAPNKKVLTVLNDKLINDTDPFTSGNQSDSNYEVTLGNDGSIQITLSRALTLPGGVFYKYLNAQDEINSFKYDMFLRDSTGYQRKVMEGNITLNKSVTMWV